MISAADARARVAPTESDIKKVLAHIEAAIENAVIEKELSTHIKIPYNTVPRVRATLESFGYRVINVTKDSYCISWSQE